METFMSFLIVLIFVPWVPEEVRAHIAEFDDHWNERAMVARDIVNNAYHPNPLEVVNHINAKVHEATSELNSTRRGMAEIGLPLTDACSASNPIDQCWRCDPSWALDRKKMGNCALGFGRFTTGGREGQIYVVTDASDDDVVEPKPGTLRYAVVQNEPLWIVFASSMIIKLTQELIINNNKTIDGRGANVHIAYGAGFTLQFIHNVIVHNLQFHNIKACEGGIIRDSADHKGLRTKSDGDAISVYGSAHIWIDHCSFRNCADGLIDIIEQSTAITISNNYFTHHNDVMLMGASDHTPEDAKMQVTVAFNHFGKGLVQRMPRLRWGFAHLVNNDYTHWLMYAVGGSSHPTILSQGNRYIAPPLPFAKAVTKRDFANEQDWKQWDWKTENDLFLNGAIFEPSGDPNRYPKLQKEDVIPPKSGHFARGMCRSAGTLTCSINKPC